MARRNKKAKARPTYRFAGRVETGELEQQIATLLITSNFNKDAVTLRDLNLDTLLVNRGFTDEQVVIVPRSILERVYDKLIITGLTTERGGHPRLNSKTIKTKLELQEKVRK